MEHHGRRHSLWGVHSAQNIPVLSQELRSDLTILDVRLRSLDEELSECVSLYRSITADESEMDKRFREMYNNLSTRYNSVDADLARIGSTAEGFENTVRKIIRKEIDRHIMKKIKLDELSEMIESRYSLLKEHIESHTAKNCTRIERLMTEVDGMDHGFDEDDPRYSLTEERIDYLMIELQKITV